MEVKVLIGLGSNLGDGKTILKDAWEALGVLPGIRLGQLSDPYMTAPVDMNSQHWFTNAVGSLFVTLAPQELLQVMMTVEAGFGRVRKHQSFGYHDRSLDLDMLYFGNEVIDTPELTLPHPRIGVRLFVLAPLAEIEPGFGDIITGDTIAIMEQRLRASILAGESKKQEIIHGRWEE